MKKIFIATLLLSSISAFADDAGFAGKTGFGEGGCGLGSMIIGKNGNQILAMTLNATGTQTFAITSGTSNCVPGGGASAKLQHFIDANHTVVETDIAKGSGETISSIAKILECNGDIGKTLQHNYATIYSGSNVSENISSVLSGQCSI